MNKDEILNVEKSTIENVNITYINNLVKLMMKNEKIVEAFKNGDYITINDEMLKENERMYKNTKYFIDVLLKYKVIKEELFGEMINNVYTELRKD